MVVSDNNNSNNSTRLFPEYTIERIDDNNYEIKINVNNNNNNNNNNSTKLFPKYQIKHLGKSHMEIKFDSKIYPIGNLFEIDSIHICGNNISYGEINFDITRNNFLYGTIYYINNCLFKTINKSKAYSLCSDEVKRYVDLFCLNNRNIVIHKDESLCDLLDLNKTLLYIMNAVICEFLCEIDAFNKYNASKYTH